MKRNISYRLHADRKCELLTVIHEKISDFDPHETLVTVIISESWTEALIITEKEVVF